MCFCKDLQIPNLPEQKCPMCWDRVLFSEVKGCSEGPVVEASGSQVTAQVPGHQVDPGENPPKRPEALSVESQALEEKALQLLKCKDFSFAACETLLDMSQL